MAFEGPPCRPLESMNSVSQLGVTAWNGSAAEVHDHCTERSALRANLPAPCHLPMRQCSKTASRHKTVFESAGRAPSPDSSMPTSTRTACVTWTPMVHRSNWACPRSKSNCIKMDVLAERSHRAGRLVPLETWHRGTYEIRQPTQPECFIDGRKRWHHPAVRESRGTAGNDRFTGIDSKPARRVSTTTLANWV